METIQEYIKNGYTVIVPYDKFNGDIINSDIIDKDKIIVELDISKDDPLLCYNNLENIRCISLANITKVDMEQYLNYLNIFKNKYIYVEQFIESKEMPVNYDIGATLRCIFDYCYKCDWIKKIVSLELILNSYKNVRLIDECYDDISLALLLSTKNGVPIINENIVASNKLIKNGVMYKIIG